MAQVSRSRPLRRGVLVVAAAALLLPPAALHVVAAAPAISYSANGEGGALEVVADTVEGAQVPILDSRMPHAEASVSSPSQAHSRAALLDPGALVETGAVAGCAEASPPQFQPYCRLFPDYPFIAAAGYPSQPDAEGGTPSLTLGALSLGAGRYRAQARRDSAGADASGSRLQLGSETGPVVAYESGSATAAAAIKSERASGQVQLKLSRLVLFGVVDISELDSSATAGAAPGAPGSAAGALRISGVSVAGTPATIDADGVHLVGSSVALTAVRSRAQQLLDQLAAGGASVVLAPARRDSSEGRSSYQAGGLIVSQRLPDGSVLRVALGNAAASGFAAGEYPFSGGLGAFAGPAPGPSLPGEPASAVPASSQPTARVAGQARRTLPTVPAGFWRWDPRGLLLGLFAIFEAGLLLTLAGLLGPHSKRPLAGTLRPL